MKLVVEIECYNEAFVGAPNLECARILRNLAMELDHLPGVPLYVRTLYDHNGNDVGQAEFLP